MVDTFNINIDETLNAQNEYSGYARRSSMYEFILLLIISIIVLVITIRNLTSDTVTTSGYVVCWIIIIGLAIAIMMYLTNLIGGSIPSFGRGKPDHSGPVVRIHYV